MWVKIAAEKRMGLRESQGYRATGGDPKSRRMRPKPFLLRHMNRSWQKTGKKSSSTATKLMATTQKPCAIGDADANDYDHARTVGAL
jgi:hypothetical protein